MRPVSRGRDVDCASFSQGSSGAWLSLARAPGSGPGGRRFESFRPDQSRVRKTISKVAELLAFHAIVRGRVQGVGFRYFARQRAATTGVSGFVRNLPDGSVEVKAEGLPAALEKFEAELRRGPSFSEVADVAITSVEPRGFSSFEIR